MVESESRPIATHGHLFAGRYRLGAVLGRGAMADVLHADDQVLSRPVAIKIFRHGAPADTDLRIDAEIRTLASLSHPGLVTLHDAGRALDFAGVPVPYLVMELIDGPTLNTYRDGRPLQGTYVARIGCELAEALAYIHGRGVVHRDIKPANILIAQDPGIGVGQCAKLADFGIARIVDAERLTEHGTTVGTAHYLSPEQATGTSAGPPTDIYTLGLVLIECLTGTMAFEGSAVAAAVARLHRDPGVPEKFGPQWHALLTAMTSRRPEDRPDGAAVADRLRELARSTTPLPPTTVIAVEHTNMVADAHVPPRPQQVSRRPGWVVPVVASFFVSLGAGIIWVATDTAGGSVEVPASPAEPIPVEATTATPTTPAAEPLPALPAFSNPPDLTPAPISNPVPVEPNAPSAPPGNKNPGNANSGQGNPGNGNGNSGPGRSGRGN